MNDGTIDILMVTYNRPAYTALSLERVLETCDATMRVWLWHNGTEEATLETVKRFLGHPSIHRFHHSTENVKLREPINWLFENAQGDYFSKVDDDCLMPYGWGQAIRQAHEDVARFGALGCWRFMQEDFDPGLSAWKLKSYKRHTILQNCWVEGSGFLLKRKCVDDLGVLPPGVSFPMYCKRLASRGWIHGWIFPFLVQEHMDDPRSEHCILKTDDDLMRNRPLTAAKFGVTTIEDRIKQIRKHAREVQTASLDPADFRGLRAKVRRSMRRITAGGQGEKVG